jgi:hypothetical protein
MDQKSGERFVAHFNGRGDEYDDKMATREYVRKKRGLPPPADAHNRQNSGGHSHSQRKTRGSQTGSHAQPH